MKRRRLFGAVLLVVYLVQANGEDQEQAVGYKSVQPFCRRNFVKVKALWLTCNTPGAYYYGSSAYRDSEVCMKGDTANLRIEFVVPSGMTDQASLGLQLESGFYDSFQSVTNSTSICTDFTVTQNGESNDYDCPEPGSYMLQTYFSVPSIKDNSFHYTPDIKVTFYNPYGKRVGCSTTGTVAMLRSADSKATHGWIALGFSIVAFLSIFALLLYLSYRRKKRLEKKTEEKRQPYQYFQTLPNGQVVPYSPPSSESSTRRQESRTEDTENALNISNPSYNETHIPTRPII